MKNRIALVTGGFGDIGTAVCQDFHKRGANVIAVDWADQKSVLLWQEQQKKLGFEIGVAHADVNKFNSCVELAKDIENRFGTVEILVNCAGIINDAVFRKMTPLQWNQVVHTDLDSLFNVTRQFINGMIKNCYGRIINISSVSAEKGQFGQTNYSSAKSGIYGFSKSLALEVAKYGITVNSISPVYVESTMAMSIAENIREKIISQIPVGRFANPAEIAWAISFLASEQSAFITGSNLAINGGIHMY